MIFRDYLKEKFKNEDIIEFGPLTRPLFKKGECRNISYADIRSTEEIKELYTDNDYLNKTGIKVNIDEIVDIDYKVNGSYIDTFKEKKFTVAYLSHVIEHMPDIVNFFTTIGDILKEDGKLAIIYPDKRYSFDHFRNSVSFRDAYATYKYGLRESARIAFDFGYNVVHENDPAFFWKGTNLIDVISKNNLADAEKYYEETLNGKISNDDVHFWPFSDIDFLEFIYELKRANLFSYEVEEFYPTQENTQEFMIILKKSTNKDCTSILELINKYDIQTKEREYKNEIDKKSLENEKIKTERNIELQQKEQETENKTKQIEKLLLQIQEIEVENQKIEQLMNDLKEKDQKIEQLMEELKAKEQKIGQLIDETNGKDIKIEQLNKQVEELTNEVVKINNSKSMKITAPLRKIAKMINKGE